MLDQRKIEGYKSLELLARQTVEGFITGLHKSPFHGFSVEFAEHRLYNNGESIKNIDWKLYGRTDKLFVKRFEEETNLRCQLVIDTSSSMYFPFNQKISFEHPNKITFSVYASAVLMELLRLQRDAFGLTLFSDKIDFQSQTKSSILHQRYLYHELEKLLTPISTEEQKKTSVADCLHDIAERIHKRSLVIVFTDALGAARDMDNLFHAMQHLKHCKHEVIFFHVFDKSKEIDFEYENRPYYFIDVETGEKIKVNPLELKEIYVNAINKSFAELKTRCINYRIDYVDVDINKGFRQILQSYLLKRSKLY